MQNETFNIIINKKSGTFINLGEEVILDAIKKSRIKTDKILLLDPLDIEENLIEIANSGGNIIIGGGDGTIRATAKTMMSLNKPFGILPFGTMNLLAKDLGVKPDVYAALCQYKENIETIKIDASFVNENLFLCAASIGTMPHASLFRETIRGDDNSFLFARMFLFVLDKLDKQKRKKVTIYIDGQKKKIKSAAVVVSNNAYADTDFFDSNNFLRPSLRDGKLAVYATILEKFWDTPRLLFKLIFGSWKRDHVIKAWEGKKIVIQTKYNREPVSIDGEVMKLSMPLIFNIEPQAINLIVPKEI